ncbi:MAG: YdcF family protein [Ekhidna sp.]|nr:YdcF family protein [Ekhidna sp.]MBC6411246.1 YdcF family protein [Ekhidna sp.]MBC6426973.1 YdcF family protein [Ekhidna sp.]
MPPVFIRLVKIVFLTGVFLFLFVLGTNIWVVSSTRNRIRFDFTDIPAGEVALVLGTSKQTSSGQVNRFFVERMHAAAMLYKNKSIKHILVSGDNSTKFYNEPIDMLNALEDFNIPDSVVSLDYAGFRTLDSIVRSKEIFGQHSIIIVTQEFHCYRALFIAKYFGIDAIAVSADDGGSIGSMLAMREIIARTVAVLDLYVLQRKPKFLGEKIKLNIN